jgi:hypothetical protein
VLVGFDGLPTKADLAAAVEVYNTAYRVAMGQRPVGDDGPGLRGSSEP